MILADRNSELVEIAEEEINEFRDHAETYADDEILGLAQIAAAALVDHGRIFRGREDAIRYLALNASAVLEDLWATDDTLWKNAPARQSSLTTWSQSARPICSRSNRLTQLRGK